MEFKITNYMKLNVMGENLIKIYGIREAQGAPGEGYSLTRSRAAYIGYSSGS